MNNKSIAENIKLIEVQASEIQDGHHCITYFNIEHYEENVLHLL